MINEFGAAGIDGSLIQGEQGTQNSDITVREVPGGCLCCAAGLPAQMAINSLLARTRPDRLLIEPTGLGHPQEILQLLQSEHYRAVIDLKATLTLVDARKIQDDRYTQHDTFRQQLEVADVIVASKSDLYSAGDIESLQQFTQIMGLQAAETLVPAVQGNIPLSLLDKPSTFHQSRATESAVIAPAALTKVSTESPAAVLEFPTEGYLCLTNEADGFLSRAWVFRPSLTFDHGQILSLLRSLYVTRLKAVVITDDGIVGVNHLDGVTTEIPLDEAADSRIEIITETGTSLSISEKDLLACLI